MTTNNRKSPKRNIRKGLKPKNNPKAKATVKAKAKAKAVKRPVLTFYRTERNRAERAMKSAKAGQRAPLSAKVHAYDKLFALFAA